MSSRDLVVAAAGSAGSAGAAKDDYFKNVSLLLSGDGTNGAQNNTFLDSSTNNFTITRNGNTTQGSFSPYGNLWSNSFSAGNYFSIADNAAFALGSNNFTIETFVFVNRFAVNSDSPWGTVDTQGFIADQSTNSSSNRSWMLFINASKFNFYVSLNGGSTAALNLTSTTTVLLGTWYHLAVVRNGNTFTLYVNGVAESTATYSGALYDSTKELQIGDLIGNGGTSLRGPLNGYLSNFRIVKGTAVYTSTFTPSTTPLTAVSGTSLLTCQSNRFIDNSSNNFTLTVNGNTSVQRFSPFNPTAPYSTATIGGSGYFDGTGDYLSVADSDAFWIEGDFTIEAWVYPLSSADSTILAQWPGSSNTSFTFRYGATTGRPYFAYSTNGTTGLGGSGTTTSVILNQWNHIAVSRSGSTVRLFVNGSVDATTFTVSGALYNSTGAITNWTINSSSYLPTGYLSQIRFVKGTAVYTGNYTVPTAPLTAITNTSLLCNFTNAGIPDAAMMNDLETVGNAQVSTSVKKYGTGSLAFDGTGDGIRSVGTNVNLQLGSGNFTIEGWVYFNSVSGNAQILNTDTGTTGTSYAIYRAGTTLQFFLSSAGVGWNIASGATIGTVATNTWYHFALVRNGSTFTPYFNGVAGSSVTSSASLFANANVGIGNNAAAAATEVLNGYIDDLRITKGYARYTANFTPPAQALPTN